jgi:aspartate-semialdehyde dehydrogenase
MTIQNDQAITNDKAIVNPVASSETLPYIDVRLENVDSDTKIIQESNKLMQIRIKRSSLQSTITRSDYSLF